MQDALVLVVDAALVFTIAETAGLLIWRAVSGGGGLPVSGFLANLVAGLFLMAALRGAVGGAAWPWIAACLAAAGVAHAADMRERLQRHRRR